MDKTMHRCKAIILPAVMAVLLLFLLLPGAAFAAAKKVTLYVDSATQATKTLTASGLNAKKATWTSSKKAVATVKAGKVTAKKAGSSVVKAKEGSKTYTFNVTVKKVSLNKKSATLAKGKTLQLKLTGDKIKATKSSKTSVATVSKTGKVTAKKAGKAKITVTSKKGKNYTCTVTVKSAAPVAPEEAILGVETNSVVLAGAAGEFRDGYFIHLKVKDSSIAYEKWSKSLKLKLADGATTKLVANPKDDWSFGEYKVTSGILTVTSGGKSLDYTVEAFQESSGMY